MSANKLPTPPSGQPSGTTVQRLVSCHIKLIIEERRRALEKGLAEDYHRVSWGDGYVVGYQMAMDACRPSADWDN